MSHRQQHQQLQQQRPVLHTPGNGNPHRAACGCFVKLHPPPTAPSSSPPATIPISGLVHVSQLYANGRVTNVSDIVSLDDVVWVKVTEVVVESIDVDGGDGAAAVGHQRKRHKIGLSMKYVDQETGADVDPDNELLGEDLNQRRRRRWGREEGRRGRGGFDDGDGGTRGADFGARAGTGVEHRHRQRHRSGESDTQGKEDGYDGRDDGGIQRIRVGGGGRGRAVASARYPRAARRRRDGPSVVLVDECDDYDDDDDEADGEGRGTTLPAWMTRRDDDRTPRREGWGRRRECQGATMTRRMGRRRRRRRKNGSKKKRRRGDNDEESGSGRGRGAGAGAAKAGQQEERPCQREEGARAAVEAGTASPLALLLVVILVAAFIVPSSSPRPSSSSSGSRDDRRPPSSRRRRRQSHRPRDRDRRGGGDDDGPTLHHTPDFANLEEARAIMERLERRRGDG
ncbi:hypothetical protein ACHAW5_002702 [Stephanodiscus triporus]|uniref:S1 motif domain-containing protein n=1 Tax=Stephanodiscus triporus TaxID=2934178 RepID=A0ABD3MH81_9STRA